MLSKIRADSMSLKLLNSSLFLVHAFSFISNTRLKFVENLANAKQHLRLSNKKMQWSETAKNGFFVLAMDENKQHLGKI